jgi:hypothetical protein
LNSFILQPANTSNIDEDTPGLWTMAILNDPTSGASPPNTPLTQVLSATWIRAFFTDPCTNRLFKVGTVIQRHPVSIMAGIGQQMPWYSWSDTNSYL